MRLKYGIAVAGSHGKTTTTSMTATILNYAGLDPTVVVGGRVGTMGGSNARVGRSDFLVVESDESDGSFLKLAPIIAVVTNIDREHLDHYPSLDAIRAAFIEFVNKVPFYGAAIVCLDDANVQGILPAINRRTITYGTRRRPTWKPPRSAAAPSSSDFRLRYRTPDLGRFHLRIPGRHNVLNAMAAVAVALELEVKPDTIREALATFSGVDRRFQVRGKERGITVVDDYGHHPTEIRATLDGARLCGFRRIHVLFQPHRYTRTFHLMDEFARSFHQADSRFRDGYLRGLGEAHRGRHGRGPGGAHPPVRPPRRGVRRARIERGVEALLAAAAGRRPGPDAGRGQRLAGRREDPASGCGRRAEMARASAKIQRFPLAALAGHRRAWRSSASPPPWRRCKVREYALVRPAIQPLPRPQGRAHDPGPALYARAPRCSACSPADFDHSIFLVPLGERRRRLLAIDWVEDASVSRVWPDRLVVRHPERKPVAFVLLPLRRAADRLPRHPAGAAAPGAVHLPGARRRPRGRDRGRSAASGCASCLRVQEELGYLAKDVSEVNAADPDNVRIVAQVDNRALELILGDSNFARATRIFQPLSGDSQAVAGGRDVRPAVG